MHTATTPPINPCTTPSSMNGIRTNQLVAPTSFMIPISLRREKMAILMVVAMRIVAAMKTMIAFQNDILRWVSVALNSSCTV